MQPKVVLSWVLRLIAAGILLQTLFFKFTAAHESVYIFSTLGMEPWGRIGTGVAELLVGILLIIPGTAWLGAIGGMGLMAGAIFAHLTKLGIEVQGDGGLLFSMALGVLIICISVLFVHRMELVQFIGRFR